MASKMDRRGVNYIEMNEEYFHDQKKTQKPVNYIRLA